MTDPYQILGLSQTATDDEIKKTYRQLCKRYHPDANIGNPNAEQIEKKFMEIQQAYEQIMHWRHGGSNPNTSYYGQQHSSNPYSQDPFASFFGGSYGYDRHTQNSQDIPNEMRAAKNYIDAGHYAEALNALNLVSPGARNAYWYYLSSLAQVGLHNNAQALEYARQALNMDPGNFQYQQLLSFLQNGGNWYGQRGSAYGRKVQGQPNLCCTFLMAQMLCTCCSGGSLLYYPCLCCC